jgi:hypothetical protein
MHYYSPLEAADYGKVMIWSFIAGYSERLVPYLLHSISTEPGKEPKK